MHRVRSTTEAPGDDPLAGDAKYRVLGLLGAGGMGAVYEAEHLALGLRVVIKVLHGHLVDCPRSIDRFRLEAQALARLDHPNLVRVTDFGITARHQPYFVMERLAGRTLHEALRADGALGVARALAIAAEALAGLEGAHAAGLVHRDVKPANLFLVSAGRPSVKVLDFGIAKVAAEVPGAPSPLALPTAQGVLIGTPRWVSPEQALGRPVDARSDVYGFGLVLFAMLCGRGPFDELGGPLDIVRGHLERPPPPPSRFAAGAIPPALDAAVERALAKRPGDRFPTARAFAEALARISVAPASAVAATGARHVLRQEPQTASGWTPARAGAAAPPLPDPGATQHARPRVPDPVPLLPTAPMSEEALAGVAAAVAATRSAAAGSATAAPWRRPEEPTRAPRGRAGGLVAVGLAVLVAGALALVLLLLLP